MLITSALTFICLGICRKLMYEKTILDSFIETYGDVSIMNSTIRHCFFMTCSHKMIKHCSRDYFLNGLR